MKLYREPLDAGSPHRAAHLAQVKKLVRREQRRADARRRRFFRPDTSSVEAYAADIERYREQFKTMLGWPLTEPKPADAPPARVERVARDDLGTIDRVWIETLPGLETYGLLFRPKGRGRRPLVISQHGGGGTPELCSDFFGSANYNDMTRRVLRRGSVVFAPQLLLWSEDLGPAHTRQQIDLHLKQLGGSVTALELRELERCIDWLTARPDVDAGRVGMIGLSYGGFYTLFAAAVDTRIKAAVSSCFFNDRKVHAWADWVWPGSAHTFLDAEVAGLICPRALHIEVGVGDEMFAFRDARREAARVQRLYDTLGIPRFMGYKEHAGGHELDVEDDGIEFLCRHLIDP